MRPASTTDRPPLDPRIRERRDEVRRHQGRRRRLVLIGLAGVVSAVVGAWLVVHSPLVGVRQLVVVGAAHLIGKGGLIELLKARGYTVEQM